MFTGRAEEAINFYVSLFPDGKIVSLKHFGPNQGGVEGTVFQAVFSLAGQEFKAFDSPPMHAFSFTPSMSIFVTCDSKEQVDTLFAALSEGGSVMMPLDSYPFSERFAWCADRFGVSWQLSLGA